MRHTIRTSIFALLPILAACGDDGGLDAPGTTESTTDSSTGEPTTTAPEGTEASSGAGSTTSVDPDTSGTPDGSSDDGSTSTGEPAQVELEVIAAFDPAAYGFPEGLAIDGDDAIVGFAFTGAVERVALGDGARSALAVTPPLPANTSFVTGVVLDAEGRVHAAVVSFTAELAAGIYRAPADGGDAVLWASDPAMVFPNGLAWDDGGRLYVTDSAFGGVFAVDTDGLVSPWLQDPWLAGDPSNCGGTGDIAVGANGVVWTEDALLVAGNDLGVLVRVPIEADGTAGTPEAIAGPDCALVGMDGIVLDDDGSVIAALNRTNRLVRIDTDGDTAVLAEGAPLDYPASLAFAGDGSLVVTSFALGEFFAMGTPAPALVRVTLP